MNLAYPYTFDHRGRSAEAGDERHIRDLIEQVLFTMQGERVMRPDFGAGLLTLVFEPNSVTLAATTQMLAQAALHQHLAHLIAVTSVEVINDDAVLRVEIRYVVLADRTSHVASFAVPGGAA